MKINGLAVTVNKLLQNPKQAEIDALNLPETEQ